MDQTEQSSHQVGCLHSSSHLYVSLERSTLTHAHLSLLRPKRSILTHAHLGLLRPKLELLRESMQVQGGVDGLGEGRVVLQTEEAEELCGEVWGGVGRCGRVWGQAK